MVLLFLQNIQAADIYDSRIFNVQFYSNFYHDLQSRFGNNRGAFYDHWAEEGLAAGRQGVATFCAPQYEQLNNLSSLFNHNNTALAIHYIEEGHANNLNGIINGENGRYTIKNSVVSVGVSRLYAGAIDSIVYNNDEYIQAMEHNRQMQHTFAINGHGECYRPTESGSVWDSGNTTSTIINNISISADTIYTSVYPAFFAPPGSEPYCGRPINNDTVSDFLFTKKITLGFGNLQNVIRVESTVTASMDAFLSVEGPASFYNTMFDESASYNFSSKALLTELHPNYPTFIRKGQSTIAIFDPSTTELMYSYGKSETDQIRGMVRAVIYRNFTATAGIPISYSFFIIVGTQAEVINSIDTLVNYSRFDCSVNNGGCDPMTTCTNIGLTRNCSECPSGYSGNGNTSCTDINECNLTPSVCPIGFNCSNLNGSHACLPYCASECQNGGKCVSLNECNCTETFTGQYCSISLIRNCQVDNGGCDKRVKCINNRCEPCPNGTHGNPEIGCSLLCGDGLCDLEFENCLLCPQDCRNVSCDLCGDLICNKTIGENCSTCFEDCGPCDHSCSEGCSGNGECHEGLCSCNHPWSGPTCSTRNEQLSAIVEAGLITINSLQQFYVSISSIEEIDKQENIVRSYSFYDLNFSLVENNVSGKNTLLNFSSVLDNSAIINFIIRIFNEEQTNFEFANINSSYSAHTVKVNVKVQQWPFYSISNSLVINMDAKSNSAGLCVNDKKDEKQNVKWFMLNVDDVTLYGQFLDKVIVDGRVRAMSYKSKGGASVSAFIPHFWDHADMDPNYSVLLGDTNKVECKNSEEKEKNSKIVLIIIIVVPSVVGIILFIALSIFAYPRIKLWYQLRGKGKLSKVRSADTEL